jgi:hypothetical protein
MITTAHASQILHKSDKDEKVFGRYEVSRVISFGKVVSYFITTVSGIHEGTCAKASLVIFMG